MCHLAFARPRNSSGAASDPQNELIDQIGPGVRKGDAIGGERGIGFLALAHLLEKLGGIVDLSISDEQLDNLIDGLRLGRRVQIQCDLLFIEKIGKRDGHGERRICWIIRKRPVIQLIDPPWQLKTLRPQLASRGPSRSNAAFTIRATSMPCRIFTAVSLAASWSGGNGSISQPTGRSPAAPPLSPSRSRTRPCRTSFSFSISPSFGECSGSKRAAIVFTTPFARACACSKHISSSRW